MSRHFLFEEKPYEIDPYFKRVRERVYRFPKFNAGKGGKSGGGPVSGWGEHDTRQKCVVKMHYSRNREAHKFQLEKYITREGAGKDGKKPEFYGADLEQYRRKMVPKNFRIFLSPEKSSVPLKTLTNAFIKKLENHTGYRFHWVAADHYNTAHPHTHILINGRDQNGRDIVFKRDVVKVFMREYARDICTTLVGSRTREDMLEEREKQLESDRYTAVDGRLKAFMKENKVDLSQFEDINFPKEKYKKRLEHLRKLKVCEWKGGGYEFTPDWEETLKTAGKYNSYLCALDDLKHTDRLKLTLYQSEAGAKSGKITKIYRTDEVSDNHAVLLEAVDGKAYFAPLFQKPKVKEGDFVEIIPKVNEKGRLSPQINKIDGKTLYGRVSGSGRDSPMADVARQSAERQVSQECQARGRDGGGVER